MRNLALAVIAVCVIGLGAGVAIGHHAAQGMAPDEIWMMIDELLEGTPHAEMDITDIGPDSMDVMIMTPTVRGIQDVIGEGLLEYFGMFGSELTVTIEMEGWTRPVMYVHVEGMAG